MNKNNQTWVSPTEDGWKVQHPGAERASGIFDTKKEAVKRGREISRNQGTELIIQNLDGKISQKDSHGIDNFPPRG